MRQRSSNRAWGHAARVRIGVISICTVTHLCASNLSIAGVLFLQLDGFPPPGQPFLYHTPVFVIALAFLAWNILLARGLVTSRCGGGLVLAAGGHFAREWVDFFRPWLAGHETLADLVLAVGSLALVVGIVLVVVAAGTDYRDLGSKRGNKRLEVDVAAFR